MQRVAAYCRVSTDKTDQVNSLDSQKKYFREYIERNSLWQLTQVYVDEGITGTSTKKRHSFNKMIADAENHKFDLIITKEISRFARNTLDSILYTRKLKDLGIGVIFLNDNINTLDQDAELRLTIMSSIAQEESRKTSERVKWGQKRRMEQGVVFGRNMLGYDVQNGKLYINEKGKEIVQLIFHKFTIEGKGTHTIARELEEAGIPTATQLLHWSSVSLLRILRNEKYVGDLIQKKTYTPNYLNHDKKMNQGEVDFIVIPNHHAPIISRELFEQTQEEIKRRSLSVQEKSKHSNRYCLSGKIKCGNCNSSYVSRVRKRKDGSVSKSWRCYRATKYGVKHTNINGEELGCDSKSIQEETIKSTLQKIIADLQLDKQHIILTLNEVIKSIIAAVEDHDNIKKLENRKKQLQKRKQGLIELYLSEEVSKGDFLQLNQKYDLEMNQIESALQENNCNINELGTKENHNQYNILTPIENALKEITEGKLWEDMFYHQLIDKIIIREDRQIEVNLKFNPHSFVISLHK